MQGREHLADAKRGQSAVAAARRQSAVEGPGVAGKLGAVPAQQLLALQRSAGNAAAVRWMTSTKPGGPPPAGPSLSAAAEKAGDVTSAGDANNQFTGASVAGGYRNPDATTNAAQYGSVVGSGVGTVTSAAGLVGQGVRFHRARMDRKNAKPGTAEDHALGRDMKAGAGGTAEQGLSFVNMSTGLAAAVMNLKHVVQAAVSGVAAASSGIGVVAASVQSVRFIRKADRARRRVAALQRLMDDQNKPKQALRAANDQVEALQKAVNDGRTDVETAEASFEKALWEQAQQEVRGAEVDFALLVRLLERADQAQAALERDQADLEAARIRQDERAVTSAKMQDALEKQTEKAKRYRGGAVEDISLRDIQEYAARKNSRGTTMKAIGAVAGLLGVGGSIVSMVAGVALAAGVAAGAGVLVATPVGWGLAGAAATVALGSAGWKTWRFFQHRWEQSAAPETAGGPTPSRRDRLRRTLAVWKDVGPNERDQHAAALYEMARDETRPERVKEARDTLVALGLSWDEMKDDSVNGKKLIAAKFASA